MADDFQDRTENATAKKLDKAREKGNVVQSRELTSSSMLFVAIVALYILGPGMYEHLTTGMRVVFTHLAEPIDSLETATFWLRQGLLHMAILLAPFLGVLVLFALAINIAQVGLVLSFEMFNLKWGKLNIFQVKNLQKFFGMQALMRLLLGLAKLAIITTVCVVVIIRNLPRFSHLMQFNGIQTFMLLCQEVFWLGLILALLLLVIGIVDWTFQKWKFMQEMKMTKQEIKEEYKQAEGDPKIKSKIRSMMHSFINSRMKSNVPKADVIIANPIHYAIAIKYDAENMSAPICVAKGARKMAIIIKELAKEHNIPIVENPPLARALYKSVDVGTRIPQNFYHAVAEVLAYVYRLNEQVKKQSKWKSHATS